MSHSNLGFSVKFFRPPQRSVSSHSGLLDTRTKRTIAQDRLVVAEKQKLDSERRKSATNLQSLAFEQKQLEKRLSSLHNLDQSLHTRQRSISEANLRHIQQINELSTSLNQNLLSLPQMEDFQRRFSASSDGDASEHILLTSDPDSGDEDNSKTIPRISLRSPPMVAIIPPEEENLYLIQ